MKSGVFADVLFNLYNKLNKSYYLNESVKNVVKVNSIKIVEILPKDSTLSRHSGQNIEVSKKQNNFEPWRW